MEYEKDCCNCKHESCGLSEEPCVSCYFDGGGSDCFEMKENLKYVVDDPVKHPYHYTKGKIEVWDFIADQKLNYDRGCAIKYICRAGKKDPAKEIEDLQKAANYINHEIKMLKGEIENDT